MVSFIEKLIIGLSLVLLTTFENVVINCHIDAYNDCTASYDYYNYRMCGMIIGGDQYAVKGLPAVDGVTVNYPALRTSE